MKLVQLLAEGKATQQQLAGVVWGMSMFAAVATTVAGLAWSVGYRVYSPEEIRKQENIIDGLSRENNRLLDELETLNTELERLRMIEASFDEKHQEVIDITGELHRLRTERDELASKLRSASKVMQDLESQVLATPIPSEDHLVLIDPHEYGRTQTATSDKLSETSAPTKTEEPQPTTASSKSLPWPSKTIQFPRLPYDVETCYGQPDIRIENLGKDDNFRVVGIFKGAQHDLEKIKDGSSDHQVELTPECRLVDIQLHKANDYRSGGKLVIEYRSTK